jgi:ACS family hexuronate transporter-like MFS transporter
MTDPVWWLYLFWIPDFLNRVHGIDLRSVGLPLVVIYVFADAGSIGGGWLSSSLLARGWSVNAARKTAMFACAVAVTPIVFAPRVESLWLSVALIGLAAAAHQGWSANLYTLASDTFPRRAVASLVGLGGMTGAVGGMVIAKVTAAILDFWGSYVPVFMIAALTYLVALAIVHALTPTLAPARLDG